MLSPLSVYSLEKMIYTDIQDNHCCGMNEIFLMLLSWNIISLKGTFPYIEKSPLTEACPEQKPVCPRRSMMTPIL